MNLRIGIPSKGRLADAAAELLVEAGLKFRRQDRSLFARVRDMPIDVTFLRTDDIPILCAEGAIDLGITGGDLVEEAGVELQTRLSLGLGNCRLAFCVPKSPRTWRARASPRASPMSRRPTLPGTKSRATSSSSPARWK
jgi:ATP phosphoribosyltransferase